MDGSAALIMGVPAKMARRRIVFFTRKFIFELTKSPMQESRWREESGLMTLAPWNREPRLKTFLSTTILPRNASMELRAVAMPPVRKSGHAAPPPASRNRRGIFSLRRSAAEVGRSGRAAATMFLDSRPRPEGMEHHAIP